MGNQKNKKKIECPLFLRGLQAFFFKLKIENSKTILWLNTSLGFDKRSIILWVIRPSVLIRLLYRIILLLFIQLLKSKFNNEGFHSSEEKVAVNKTPETDQDTPKSLLDLLLYRKVFREETSAVSSHFETVHTEGHPLNSTGKTVLIIDAYFPRFDKESGSNRIFHTLKIIKSLGYRTVFMTASLEKEEPYVSILQQMGIETLYSSNQYNADEFFHIHSIIKNGGIAWICRPELNYKYVDFIKLLYPSVKIIYDTIDLHFLRLERQEKITLKTTHWEAIKEIELQLCNKVDKIISITDIDKGILISNGIEEEKIQTVPNIHIYKKPANSFLDRSGLLFIGSYIHTPNVDAAIWLCNEIMPLVWETIPEMTITLLGHGAGEEIQSLASDKIKIPGYIKDVDPYFEASKVFVAPLRFGAGMKGKLGQSFEFGLPIVSTNVGIEGMGLIHGETVLVANTSIEFASQIIKLYQNQALWNTLSANSEKAIAPFSPEHVKKSVIKILESLGG